MKVLTLLSCALLLAACNAGYSPRFYYGNIEVANLTGGDISNVKIDTGERELSCATVASNALCQERFPKRPYPEQALQLSWLDSNGQQQVRQPNPSIPLTLSPSLALRLLLEINADGSVKVYFRQDNVFPN